MRWPDLKHRMAVAAHFDWALALTLSAPEERLAPLVAPGLALSTVDGHGFVAVACVQTRRLRPVALPSAFGLDCFLAGYRVFVDRTSGPRVRGLQILRSETDRRLMALGGRALTHYHYRHVSVTIRREGPVWRITTSSGLALAVRDDSAELPAGSVFKDWDSARRYAGPMPYSFAPEKDGRHIVSIKGTRAHWKPRPVALVDVRAPFFDALVGPDVLAPAAAFLVEDVEYRWEPGVRQRVD